jgi:putative FmdB family regulatory protein
MPFYEYECPACKYYTEVLQKISDKPLAKCPSCGKKGFKRLISAPVFRLKGSGWYETDFKSGKDSQRNLAGAEREEAKPAAEAKGDVKSETTPAADAPGAEKPKAEAAAAKADKVDAPAAEPPARGDAKRSGRSAAKPHSRGAVKRGAKRAPRRGTRAGRRR